MPLKRKTIGEDDIKFSKGEMDKLHKDGKLKKGKHSFKYKIPVKENQLPDSSKLLRLQEPMLIKYIPRVTEHGISDYIALVKWVGFTDERIVTIPVDKIITICNATNEFTHRYGKLVGSLRESKQALPGFIQRDMKDDEWGDEIPPSGDELPPSNDNNINKKNLKDMVNWLNMPSKRIH